MDSFVIIHSLYNEIHDGLNELINEGATSQESQKQKNRLMNIMVSLEAMNKIYELEKLHNTPSADNFRRRSDES